jgi:hypothetical protein
MKGDNSPQRHKGHKEKMVTAQVNRLKAIGKNNE